MAYGALLSRAWRLVWGHKFLIAIGAAPIVIALIGSVLNGILGNLGVLLMYGGLVLAEGSLVAGIHQVITAGASSFNEAWNVAWLKKWQLAGIFGLAMIPTVVISNVMSAGLAVVWVGGFVLADFRANPEPIMTGLAIGAGLTVLMIVLLMIVMIPIGIWSQCAVIACLTEDADVMDSYRRAWAIMKPHLGQVAVLALIQAAISLGLNLVLFIPELVLLICPISWVAAWFIRGSLTAWWSAAWVMAWRGWAISATNP